jgi:ribosomal protein L12E/L44/L45/RPP1/RPP2
MWNEHNKSEIACLLASLILNDNKKEISEVSLKKVLTASGVSLENYWFYLFPKLMGGINLRDLIGFSCPVEEKIQISSEINIHQKKEEESVSLSNKESDEDMGFGLFD